MQEKLPQWERSTQAGQRLGDELSQLSQKVRAKHPPAAEPSIVRTASWVVRQAIGLRVSTFRACELCASAAHLSTPRPRRSLLARSSTDERSATAAECPRRHHQPSQATPRRGCECGAEARVSTGGHAVELAGRRDAVCEWAPSRAPISPRCEARQRAAPERAAAPRRLAIRGYLSLEIGCSRRAEGPRLDYGLARHS